MNKHMMGISSPMTLLVVDDNPDNLFVIEQLVKEYIPSCSVLTTTDPLHALDMTGSNRVDGVVCDIQMPQMNGIELCKRLKESELTADVPVLLMTSHKATPQIRAMGLEAGADDFISKPVDNIEFAARIKVILRIKHTFDLLNASKLGLEQEVSERTADLVEANRLITLEKEKAQKYLDIAGVMFVVLDLSGKIIRINKIGCEILECGEQEILGRDWFSSYVKEEERLEFYSMFETMVNGGQKIPPYYQHSIITESGAEKKISFHNTFLVDDQNVLEEIIFSGIDITAQLKFEEEKRQLQFKLQQAQKMEAIGTLAGGIAHDFNNILSVIIGFTDLTREEVKTGSQIEKNLIEVSEAGLRAKSLVQQILAFSRQAELEKVPLQLQPLIKEAMKMLRSSIPTTISIEQNIDAGCGNVLADPTQINQVLMNLCTNANHAMEKKGGLLRVELTQFSVDSEELSKSYSIAKGLYAKLSVSDTGDGIDSDTIGRIFDPYFTTKELGKGTGMGLSIVHGIVSESGGTITVDSLSGKGSTFNVYFPIIETITESGSAGSEMENIPKGSGHILLVDDEPSLVKMLSRILTKHGYSVTAVHSSSEALVIFEENPNAFDAVITDQTMPQLTGAELSKKLLQISPHIPIILCTGYSNQVDSDVIEAIGIKGFLSKPISTNKLALLLRQILGSE